MERTVKQADGHAKGNFGYGEDWEGKQRGEMWLRWIESTVLKGRGWLKG